MAVVGNKCDNAEMTCVKLQEAGQVAKKIGAKIKIEVSAKDGLYMDELLQQLGAKLMEQHVDGENERLKLSQPKKKKGCCKS